MLQARGPKLHCTDMRALGLPFARSSLPTHTLESQTYSAAAACPDAAHIHVLSLPRAMAILPTLSPHLSFTLSYSPAVCLGPIHVQLLNRSFCSGASCLPLVSLHTHLHFDLDFAQLKPLNWMYWNSLEQHACCPHPPHTPVAISVPPRCFPWPHSHRNTETLSCGASCRCCWSTPTQSVSRTAAAHAPAQYMQQYTKQYFMREEKTVNRRWGRRGESEQERRRACSSSADCTPALIYLASVVGIRHCYHCGRGPCCALTPSTLPPPVTLNNCPRRRLFQPSTLPPPVTLDNCPRRRLFQH